MRDFFYEQSMLLTRLFSESHKAISENCSNACLYQSGGEVPSGPNALPFYCWAFQDEEEKEIENNNVQTVYCKTLVRLNYKEEGRIQLCICEFIT